MKICDICIGIPLFQMTVRIYHAAPSNLTAFGRIILNMITHISHDEVFGNIDLDRIFTDVLCVPDPSPLVIPTLHELMDRGIIKYTDIKSLDSLTLRNIEITEYGRKLVDNDMIISSKTMQNDETFYFDPICRSILQYSDSKEYRETRPYISIDDSFFSEFPRDLIRSSIENSDRNEDYGNIRKIERLSTSTLWKEVILNTEVDSGTIKISSQNNKDLNNYLASIDPEKFYDTFITPTFSYKNISINDLEKIDDNDIDNMKIKPISYILRNWPDKSHFVILGSNYNKEYIPVQAPVNQAIVLYDESYTDDISIEWNKKLSGCKIFIKSSHPIKNCFIVTDSDDIVCKYINVRYRNRSQDIIVACSIPKENNNTLFNKYISDITNLIKSSPKDKENLSLWNRFLEKAGRK